MACVKWNHEISTAPASTTIFDISNTTMFQMDCLIFPQGETTLLGTEKEWNLTSKDNPSLSGTGEIKSLTWGLCATALRGSSLLWIFCRSPFLRSLHQVSFISTMFSTNTFTSYYYKWTCSRQDSWSSFLSHFLNSFLRDKKKKTQQTPHPPKKNIPKFGAKLPTTVFKNIS